MRDILVYGFKRSFYPGTYLEKREYVRSAINYADRLLAASTEPAAQAAASPQKARTGA